MFSEGNAHLVGVREFPVVPEEVAHGHLIAFVETSATLTIQIQGILINPAIIYNTKGYVDLKREAGTK